MPPLSVNVSTKTIEVDKILWRYHLAGEGAQTLLVFSGSLGATPGIAQFLSHAIPGVRILAPDHAPVADVASYMNGIHSICESEKIQNAMVYSSSFGSLIAQCWVRRFPACVSHLILSGSAVPNSTRAASNRRWLKVLRCVPMAPVKILLKMTLHFMLKGCKESEFWHQQYSTQIDAISRKDLLSRYLVAIDFDLNQRFSSEDLKSWKGRILLLQGSKDRISGKKSLEQLQAIYPQAVFRTLEGAGHSALITHPDEWKRQVLDFLA